MTTVVEMRVDIDCPGCERKIKKALLKLDGVNDIDIDMDMQKVTVTGWAEQRKVLKAVKRTGKKVELWPYPYNPEYHAFVERYYPEQLEQQVQREAPRAYQLQAVPRGSSSYGYYKNGYDGDGYGYGYGNGNGYYQPPVYSTIIDEQTSKLFSDDNPHACSIM